MSDTNGYLKDIARRITVIETQNIEREKRGIDIVKKINDLVSKVDILVIAVAKLPCPLQAERFKGLKTLCWVFASGLLTIVGWIGYVLAEHLNNGVH